MNTTGRKDWCPCGSGKKYKKCCINKKPREHIIMVGSHEPLCGVHYDKEKMEFTGMTSDNRLIKPVITYSQTHYKNNAGKEKVITRIQDKVIPNETELMRHLSSDYDVIIAIDTNEKVIEDERISVTSIIHCILQQLPEPGSWTADFPWHGAIIFRNCPKVLHPEKFGWMAEIQRVNRESLSKHKKFAIVTDHNDLNCHTSYNARKTPIFKDFYLPNNFTLMYGRADSTDQNLLNFLVRQSDKKSTEVLNIMEQTGYYQHGGTRLSINQIPVPCL